MTLHDKINALIARYGKAEAARRIGVQWVTVHRWSRGGKILKPVETLINRAYNQTFKQ